MKTARLSVRTFPAPDYDLGATLDCGQAFRWRRAGRGWEGVLRGRWVEVIQEGDLVTAATVGPPGNWKWLTDYFQFSENLADVLASFPPDEPLRQAAGACRGLRLLRQEPWECLASFLLSSTKQIPQIRHIVARLCERFGERVETPPGRGPLWSFPTAPALARVDEAALRACGMGFRARYLAAVSRAVASGDADLEAIRTLSMAEARERLMALPGVGRKIADCVLLFAYGFPRAFPIDTWVLRALRELYFPGRVPKAAELIEFSESHFGPRGGYAQQYLFHYMRVRAGRVAPGGSIVATLPRDGN